MSSKPPHPSIVQMEDEVKKYWGRSCGVNSEIGPFRTVLVHRPGEELKAIDDSTRWLWIGKLDLSRTQKEHDAMVQTLKDEGVEVWVRISILEPRASFTPSFRTVTLAGFQFSG